MSSIPKPEKLMWLVATPRKQSVIVCSRVGFWYSHWDVSRNKSRRCGAAGCALCAQGVPKQLRYVLLVVDSQGSQRLIELRERHYGLLEQLRNQPQGELGAVLTIRKMGEAKNSPVEITCTGQERVIKQDISRLIECLGLPPRYVTEVDEAQNAALEKLFEEKAQAIADRFNVTNTTPL